jgi:L-fucose isomerase-like protein
MNDKSTFALLFGNRGFFPAVHVEKARSELKRVLEGLGHGVVALDEKETRHGGVETADEARKCSNFLQLNRGKYQGVILSLPNFGDENGAALALRDLNVPVFIQAYPDDMNALGPSARRDAFCGKLSIMDVLRQNGIKFTVQRPHVVSPSSSLFIKNIKFFDQVCRVLQGFRGMSIGQIGARTTPFKTVRIDELALQNYGITVETFDLSDIFEQMRRLSTESDSYAKKLDYLKRSYSWKDVPKHALDGLVRLGVILDEMIARHRLDALSLRCWNEIQVQFGISPCLITGDLTERGIPAACEVDTGSAIAMRALGLASGKPTMILDWNNNYGEEENKCILFHCGNVPHSLMSEGGRISDHEILRNSIGDGRGIGCVVGRIAPTDFTFGNIMTEQGKVRMYLGEGRFTEDRIPEEYFGCAGVAEIDHLQELLLYLGSAGHRHHVTITSGLVLDSVREALEKYLGFNVEVPQYA